MPNTTLICLWWLKDINFKLIFNPLTICEKNLTAKILILMAIKLNNINRFLRVNSKEMSLNHMTLYFLLKRLNNIGVIELVSDTGLVENNTFVIKYSDQEEELRELYEECWVNIPNKKILLFMKRTANDDFVTFEAILNYLMMIKGKKKNSELKKIFFDEIFLERVECNTWRDLLVQFDLVEFLEIKYSDIYENLKYYKSFN